MSGAKQLASMLTLLAAGQWVEQPTDTLQATSHTVRGKFATGYSVAFVRRTGEARNISFGAHEYVKAQECYNANVGCESTIYTALFIVTDDTGFIERDSYFG